MMFSFYTTFFFSLEVLDTCIQSRDTFVQKTSELVLEANILEGDVEIVPNSDEENTTDEPPTTSEPSSKQPESWDSNEQESTHRVEADDDYKRRAVLYWNSGRKGNLKFKTVKSKFKKVRNQRMLRRWDASVSQGKTYMEKIR